MMQQCCMYKNSKNSVMMRRIKAITPFVTLFYLGSLLVALNHFLLVDHQYCVTHGELVHAHTDHSHELPSSPVSNSTHEHCALWQLFVTTGVILLVAGQFWTVLPCLVPRVLSTPVFFSQSILHFAPKHSPPAFL